jgi:hypothetical protein
MLKIYGDAEVTVSTAILALAPRITGAGSSGGF